MKIVQFINSLTSGGAERFVVDLCNQLVSLGHSVHLVTLKGFNDEFSFNKQFLDKKVTHHCLNANLRIRIETFFKIRKLIKEIDPDVIHIHLSIIYFYPIALENKKYKLFYTFHSIANKTIRGTLLKNVARYFFSKKLITPVVISEECYKSYYEYFKLRDAFVIYNGIILPRLSKNIDKVKIEIDGYKTSENTKVFLHIARYNPVKNQRLLIDSFNKLNDEHFDFVLIIIGKDFDSAQGLLLKDTACDKIFFLGEKNNVSDYLSCSDYFCLSSFYEGLPISLLEALSIGVTPICTKVGGIKDVIIDGVYGFLSNDLSIDSYVKTIERAVSNPIDNKTLIKLVVEKYSIVNCAKKYESLYKKISKSIIK